MKLEEIRDFWEDQAIKHGQSPSASWSDFHVINLEIAQIIKYLDDDDRVLDIGCANGFSTLQFALAKKLDVRGLDYIPEMIKQANIRLKEIKVELESKIEFEQGDITQLSETPESYDKVVITRVIINLGEWEHQRAALLQSAKVLKPGGKLLLSEATVQGWQKLNRFRREWGLDDVPMPSFNNYLDQDKVVDLLTGEFHLEEIVDFASTYYVGTRVLKPLLAKAAAVDVTIAEADMDWNRWFSQIPPFGDYGVQKLFVFQKKN